MKNILLIVGSIRSGRAADKVLALTREELSKYPDFAVSVADFATMPLPFFDSAIIPSHEGFNPADKNVQRWTAMVEEADAVVVITPEYNASTSAVLKNAIDWISGPWKGKTVALIGYGWSGSASGRSHLTDIFTRLKSHLITKQAGLSFTKEINLDGSAINNTANSAVTEVLDAVKAAVLKPEALPA